MLHQKPKHRISMKLHETRLKEFQEKKEIVLCLPSRQYNLPIGTVIQFTQKDYGIIKNKSFETSDCKLFYKYTIKLEEYKGE